MKMEMLITYYNFSFVGGVGGQWQKASAVDFWSLPFNVTNNEFNTLLCHYYYSILSAVQPNGRRCAYIDIELILRLGGLWMEGCVERVWCTRKVTEWWLCTLEEIPYMDM